MTFIPPATGPAVTPFLPHVATAAAMAAMAAMAKAVVGAAMATVGAVLDPGLLKTIRAVSSHPQGVNYSCFPSLHAPHTYPYPRIRSSPPPACLCFSVLL